jgi:hypothetical protein
MGYTAIAKMQEENLANEKYKVNFPKQPEPFNVAAEQGEMEGRALAC